YFNYVRFGPYFGDLILSAAENRNLDGLFVLSLVRQESLFESFATSYASAQGLMQIIPSTAVEIVAREGWPPDFTEDDLHRPIVSIRLGVRYLADQRDFFDGDLYAALAAYNAGPGNSLAWQNLSGDDQDLFLEVIRLEQPRDYIRVIYWAYSHYDRLYVH
ncbi:MAG: transglycosylase SLT domain-containing protein, partial [Anaerolineales bacterium]